MMSQQPQTHPHSNRLRDFGLGKLESDEASEVGNHLENCPQCCETLLNIQDDSFVAVVRHASVPLGPNVKTDDESPAATVLQEQTQEFGSRTIPPRALLGHPRYEIVELIGQGGMGDVYKSEHRLMNRTVALKLINQELVRNEKAVERFRRETRAAAQLAHPNIVTAYDAEQAGDVHFLAMEYVDGTNLSEFVQQQGPLSVAQACRYIRQAASGLQHAHENGMVHRDIKPHNLMVTSDDQVKILDFGLASLAAVPEAETTAEATFAPAGGATSHLTQAGTAMGTPDYISPEQASDARLVDIRSDIYSLGCTFYFLLTGRPPFPEGSTAEKLEAHVSEIPEALEVLRPDVPKGVIALVTKMTEKDPAERPQNPSEVALAIDSLQVDDHRRVRWLHIAAALIGLVLALSIVYIQTDKGTLVIQTVDPRARIILKQNNEAVQTINVIDHVPPDENRKRSAEAMVGIQVNLRSGEYEIEVSGDPQLTVSKDRVTIRRGDTRSIVISRSPEDADELTAKQQPILTEPAAKPETQEQFAKLISAAREARTDEEWKAVIAGYTPIMHLLSPEVGRGLIELLAELPDEMHETLLQVGYLKWRTESLDEESQQKLLNVLMAFRKVTPEDDASRKALEAYLKVSDVGFAVLNLPESESQVVTWYLLLHRDPPLPVLLTVSGGTAKTVSETIKPEVRQKVVDLKDKPYTILPPGPVAGKKIRESLRALLEDMPEGKVSDTEWTNYLKQHAPYLTEAAMTYSRNAIGLLHGLPEEAIDTLLERGYLKWPFPRLDAARQSAIQNLLKITMSAVPPEHRNKTTFERLSAMLPTADVGFAILELPESESQFLVCFIQMPTSLDPMLLPILGELAGAEKQLNSPKVHKQVSEVIKQTDSKLPPSISKVQANPSSPQ